MSRKAPPNAAKQLPKQLPQQLLSGLLGFFYPIHYGISMETETRMLQGKVSRQQAAVIWLIESTVGDNGWIRRRIIEQQLRSWFESSNSHVSLLLKELASPPLSLIVQMENPQSAREKLVALTPQGRAFFQSMFNTGMEFLSERLAHISEDMARSGISFYSAITYRPPGVDDALITPVHAPSISLKAKTGKPTRKKKSGAG
ncbi:MAG: winged helix DNA-binding protein [Rudaea sp.]|uniref:hypothetical protein n=1 Tax=Rudaea sp. TaxID=2136325 RepID=UPI0039E6F566